jgi:hypothetical protein
MKKDMSVSGFEGGMLIDDNAFFFWWELCVAKGGKRKQDIPVDLFAVLTGEGKKVELGTGCV